MSKKKNLNSIITSVDMDDNFTDGFSDYIPKPCDNTLFELSFEDNSLDTKIFSKNAQISESNNIKLSEDISDLISVTKKIRGLTPPVDGETFDIKRGYQFRASTIKKLNQLKGASDNINIYLNEIIDIAICYYYDSVLKNSI